MVLEALDAEFENAKIFTDDIVRENIESRLSRKPLIMLSADEIKHKFDIEL